MDVVLGVAVTGPVARLSLLGPAAGGHAVLDESVVDLAMHPMETLIHTVVGTNQLLAGENHRLVATRLCWSDSDKADELRRALEDSGVHDVTLVSESDAATALLQIPPDGVDVHPDDATLTGLAALDSPPTVMAAQLCGDVEPGFATARGAAMTAGLPLTAPVDRSPDDSTMAAPASDATQSSAEIGAQLAYSLTGEADLLPYQEHGTSGEPEEDEVAVGPAVLTSRSLLISNAVIAFAVIGFATLAVAVAIAVRPAASQQPVQGHQNATPGKFMPLLPTQQQAPVPPPPADAPTAGFQGGTVPVAPAPGPGTPPIAPEVPDVRPGPVINVPPVIPIPIPIPVPIPIPRPPQPTVPTTVPTTTVPPTTTTTVPPTTTTTEPTTTTTTVPPTTTTTVPPTTTTTEPTTTTTTVPPTTTTAPPTTTVPPTTTAPPTTTVPPTTTTAPLTTTHTQAAVPTKRIPGL
ncbi:MAG: hypothetical protein K2Q25_10000 [Mycobacteriaceae bacterium]|nr:hypothetical protein [Mycobacteriaceae bacterium]